VTFVHVAVKGVHAEHPSGALYRPPLFVFDDHSRRDVSHRVLANKAAKLATAA
jgi:hypothetical protein